MNVHELPETWRAEAKRLRTRYQDGKRAKIWETFAEELETALRDSQMEALTVPEAALESGYSVRSLKQMLRDGTIPNAGAKGKSLILRMHLPRKPGHTLAVVEEVVGDAECRHQVARAVASGE